MSIRKTSKLETRVLLITERAGDLIRPIGVTPIPDGPVPVHTKSGEWILVAAEHDPHIERGTFVVPAPVLERLEQLETKNVSFDRLFVAHEVPTGTLGTISKKTIRKHDLTRLVPAGSPDPKTATTLSTCTNIVEGIAKVLMAPFAAVGALPAAVAAGVSSLDPALFGVLTTSGKGSSGELAAWFLIASWT